VTEGSARRPIRVLVADDSPGVRRAFRALFRDDARFVLVSTAANGDEVVQQALDHRPDIVLMDVQMPVRDGLSATEAVLAQLDSTKVLVLTTFDLDQYVADALRAGASGFLLKNSPPADILRAIEVVHAGHAMLAPEVTARLIAANHVRSNPSPSSSPLAAGVLSPRELQVTRLVAQGLSNAEIGAELFISTETAKTYVSRILTKYGVRDRTQLAVLAHQAGLLRRG
jgi:DNA-binding NarL/FixJ family response regulator